MGLTIKFKNSNHPTLRLSSLKEGELFLLKSSLGSSDICMRTKPFQGAIIEHSTNKVSHEQIQAFNLRTGLPVFVGENTQVVLLNGVLEVNYAETSDF